MSMGALVAIGTSCAKTGDRPSQPAESSLRALPATQPDDVIARIRDEGLNRSHAMATLDYLCNGIGPRLTGSPACRRANEWTRDQLASWGLANAHLEEWGPFGRGWSVESFSLRVVEPGFIQLSGYPKAWSPGLDAPLTAEVIHLDARSEDELEKYAGRLKGKIVLIGDTRQTEARFEPLATRLTDADLDRLAAAQPSSSALLGQPQPRTLTPAERRAQFAASSAQGEALMRTRERSTTQPTTAPGTRPSRRGFDRFASRALEFAQSEGAALVITPSTRGDGGTFFVQSASIPGETPGGGGRPVTQASAATGPATGSTTGPASAPTTGPTTRPRVWAKDAPAIPPQVMLAIEDYNRLVRMTRLGTKVKIAADMRVKFHDDDEMAYNTIAEIPGTDLKDQIVMVGAHLDSWHSGTGATDNAIGAAAAMEAVRIIKALDLKPRRTIRVALWTGEEQGLYGSSAYVKRHFGHDPDAEARRAAERARRIAEAEQGSDVGRATEPTTAPIVRQVFKGPDYEKFSVYFNLDNGTGKIRGIYAQSNPAAVPIFKQWLAYFDDLGADTVTLSNTGSTDHVSFDQIGLPGFQFIQDQIEYSSRTHHSNMDVYDRLQADDVKQASTIMAGFVWWAANMDERFPRKPE